MHALIQIGIGEALVAILVVPAWLLGRKPTQQEGDEEDGNSHRP